MTGYFHGLKKVTWCQSGQGVVLGATGSNTTPTTLTNPNNNAVGLGQLYRNRGGQWHVHSRQRRYGADPDRRHVLATRARGCTI